jgi:hypothetical protein
MNTFNGFHLILYSVSKLSLSPSLRSMILYWRIKAYGKTVTYFEHHGCAIMSTFFQFINLMFMADTSVLSSSVMWDFSV